MALASDIEAFWKLNESSGTRADATGNYDLSINGAVSATTFSPQFNANSFNGPAALFAGSVLNRTNTNDFHVADQDFTCSAFVKVNTFAGSRTFCGKIFGGDNNTNWAIGVQQGSDSNSNSIRVTWATAAATSATIQFSVNGTQTAPSINVPIERPILTGLWYHVVFQHIAGSGIRACLNNGTLTDEKWPFISTTGFLASSGSRFAIGGRASGAGGITNAVTGAVCNVGIWYRLLSDSEVGDLWNGGYGLDYPFTLPGESP